MPSDSDVAVNKRQSHSQEACIMLRERGKEGGREREMNPVFTQCERCFEGSKKC